MKLNCLALKSFVLLINSVLIKLKKVTMRIVLPRPHPSADGQKTRLNWRLKIDFCLSLLEEWKKVSSINFSQSIVAFLREAGAALTFFASVFCGKTKNEVGFGRSANNINIRTGLVWNLNFHFYHLLFINQSRIFAELENSTFNIR